MTEYQNGDIASVVCKDILRSASNLRESVFNSLSAATHDLQGRGRPFPRVPDSDSFSVPVYPSVSFSSFSLTMPKSTPTSSPTSIKSSRPIHDSADSSSLRKKKNADAQAAFRARRQNYISTLEETGISTSYPIRRPLTLAASSHQLGVCCSTTPRVMPGSAKRGNGSAKRDARNAK
jgi:hypothetical protein